jgi:signal transduction histidine kinase
MVVQARAARGMIGAEPTEADAAMSAVEHTGRQALSELRRVLGVLRHAHDAALLEPRPGVQQIYTLIQRAREAGQPVELGVDGEPGTLPTTVDLGIYRILEEALATARRQPASSIRVVLRFGEEDLELQLTAQCDRPSSWPTDAMRERAALCGGVLYSDKHSETGWQLTARLPRELQGALA